VIQKQKISLFIFLLSFIVIVKIRAQIVVSPTVGCAPLIGVNFSGPVGASGITWNFGDAVTSTQASPLHNYSSVGNYTVTYNAILGGNPVTYTSLVVVNGVPTANFTYTVPTIGCKPLNVQFTNTSNGPAAITSYTWNFGDGGQSSTQNTSWSYQLAGSFFPTLLVKDVNGCVSSLSPQQGPIIVSNTPTVVISSNPVSLSACSVPFTPSFSGSNCVSGSPVSGPLTYTWNFGNSQTSNLQNPGNITYNTLGVYTVSLTVKDNNNCSAATVTSVSITQPSIVATVPNTVCVNAPFTFSFQTNQQFSIWNFGSTAPLAISTTSNNPNTGVFIYNTPGLYTVNISAGSFPCTAVQTKTIFAEQVVANFTHTPPSYTCSPVFVASYINQSSSNANSFTWTATNYNGNSISISNLTNPTFTLVQGSLNPYTIYNTFSSLVTLVAQSQNGCVSSFTTHVYDSIKRPTAWFYKDKKEGCAPLVVKFRDSSFTNTNLYPITSYTWNNGATPPTLVTGNVPPLIVNPTFTYSSPGTYTPYLIIKTATGCVDTSFVDTIHVVNPPLINFSVSPNNVCWNQPVLITNMSPTTTPAIQHWHVESDNGFFSSCINNPNPQWNFTHIGVHTFTMSGYLYGCKGSAVGTQSINVFGPIVKSRYQTNCNPLTRKTVNFYNHMQDVQSATINFGDASPSFTFAGITGGVATSSVAHTYSASGNYTAIVTASNTINGCLPYTYTMLVTVRDIQANFTYSAVGCANIPQTFNASPSIDVYTGCNKRGYIWYFDNLPPRDTLSPIISQVFTTAGFHNITLMVKDENSCIDTTKHTIRISSASPNFTFSSNPICLSSGTVQMINNTPQLPDAVNNYYWDFGDASSLTTTTTTSPTHTYTSALSPSQNFTVLLVATNVLGCTDSIRHSINVINPATNLVPSQSLICVPNNTANLGTNTISFTAPSAYTSYTFYYGDGSSAYSSTNNVSPLHTYTSSGTYTVGVSVNLTGCVNSGSIIVSAQNFPIPNFTLNTGSVICRDSQVEFTNTSTVSTAYTLNWNLSNGGAILPLETVAWTYTNSGTAIITLTVTSTPNQCAAVVTKTLGILGAKANLNLDRQTICYGGQINFNIKTDSNNVYMWNYDFGDGSTSSYTANALPTQTVNHTYNFYPLPSGNTTVSLTYYPTSDPLKCPKISNLPIQIIKIPADFKRNNELSKTDSIHCINVLDQFTNLTPNSGSYIFNWGFGDGNTSTIQNPSYTYPTAGVYQVTLTTTNPVNTCSATSIKNMTINPLPEASIFARDTCQGSVFNIVSTTSLGTAPFSYTWSPSFGLSNPFGANTIATATNSTTYSLTIKDANNCINGVTKSVYIQLPAISFNWDTTVIVGQLINLNNNSGSNFSYTWTPEKDLSCINCPNPVSTTTINTTYSLTVIDYLRCFTTISTYSIIVEQKGTFDLPTAFTPNGDGVNDIIFIKGWGIKKLNYYRIYNRWGQLLFETNDIDVGWDGTYNGIIQNIETYIYQVSGYNYIDDQPILKTGTFKLIK
jgi:gliding motility-associated-like protein